MNFRTSFMVRLWLYLLLTSILLLGYYWVVIGAYKFAFHFQSAQSGPQKLIVNLSDNHFWEALNTTRGALLVDTPKCRLPDFDTFDPDVMRLIDPWTHPCQNKSKFTYMDDQTLIIDETELGVRGYSFQNISCCYRTIGRRQESFMTYTEFADKGIMYSSKCFPMSRTTIPITGFITVNCTTTSNRNVTIYQNYHVLPKFSKPEKARIQPKIAFWNTSQGIRPPNVLILGMDSTSRLHFLRTMGKTRRVLEKIGAINLKGYTKIGVNTCPNLFPVLVSHSYSFDEISEICADGNNVPMDTYNWLWNHFSNQSYVTAFLEDAPHIGNFNYAKTGFVHPPTDLYLRPWMLAAYTKKADNESCLGYQLPEEVLVKYTHQLVNIFHRTNVPYFVISWPSQFTHSGPIVNRGIGFDAQLSEMIETLYEKGMLKNTLLILLGDHGFRGGWIWKTVSGWFENYLPVMYIRLPESLKKRFPEWQEALEYNAGQLSSPWDTHEMLKEILRLNAPQALNSATPQGGISLFKKLPLRNCKDANIPPEYCVCLPDHWELMNSSVIEYSVEKVMEKVNRDLPSKCLNLSATKVTEAKVLEQGKIDNTTDYSFTFEVMSSYLKFEAQVTYDHAAGTVRKIQKVERIDKKTLDTSCLLKHEVHLKTFCVCS